MNCFEVAIKITLLHEGGYAHHPKDPGSATNYGISLRWLKKQGLYGDIDGDADVDIDDIKALTEADAVNIYRERWWDKYGYDRIADCLLAAKIMDMSVNMGARQAHKLLQRAINSLGGALDVDGIIGPRTVSSTNAEQPGNLLSALRTEQKRFYEYLISKNPNLAVFRNGWMNRAMA